MEKYTFIGIDNLVSISDDDNQWKIEIDQKISYVLEERKFPLKLKIRNYYGKKLLWETDLFPGTWASWNSPKNTELILETKDGDTLKEVPYNRLKYRDIVDDVFYYYIISRNLKKGIVLGAGAGTYGEWVDPVLNSLTSALLVEPGSYEFSELTKLFSNNSNVKLINKGVDVESGTKTFWVSSTGNISSLDKNVSLKYVGDDCLTPVEMEFISMNDLVLQEFPDLDLDWVRLDVEGADSRIIFSINPEILQRIQYLQYEHINITEDEKIETNRYLESLGFTVYIVGIDMVAMRESVS